LLCLNICARKVDIDKAPASNLVFLIDASGSMDMPNKMSLIKSGFRSLVRNLRDKDAVSIVEYGGRVGVALEGASGSRQDEITRVIEEIQPDGPTPGETGMRLAYETAQKQFIAGGNNRIVLITDGDINEGLSSQRELEDLIGQQSQAGIRLTCLAVGMDSTQNSGLTNLAAIGQGNFAYVNDEEGMAQVLVGELAPAKFPVADKVCITTEFDTSLVKDYRLLGFENKKGGQQDSAYRLQGSEVGSGHSILALFEITPKADSIGIDTIARVKIHYCLPAQDSERVMNFSCLNNPVAFEKAEPSQKKAACIALFGMKLKGSGYAAQISWSDLEKMAKKTFAGNNFMDRQYIFLVSRARKVYEHHSAGRQ
jgi:Ca-activated chloride channel homolog